MPELTFGELPFVLRQLNFGLFPRQNAGDKYRFAFMACHSLAKWIEVRYRHREYL
ncbi:hypothetical protein L580_3979 [Serratia fonticola AU-P3(3)]|nr:hypothetical protein L580_3979 [Serratia fonticola AU-P3(3)]